MPINNPNRITLTQLAAPVQFVIASGADGWIDTDVSGTTGVDTHKLWIIKANIDIDAADENLGAIPHGGVGWTTDYLSMSFLFSTVDNTGHMDFYRNLGHNTSYWLMGYIS